MGRVCGQINSLCTLSAIPALGRQLEWGTFIFPFRSFCSNSIGPFVLPTTQQTVQICWRVKIFMAFDLDILQFYFLWMHPTFAVIHYKLFSKISWPEAFFPSLAKRHQSYLHRAAPLLLLPSQSFFPLFRASRAEVLASMYFQLSSALVPRPACWS